MEVYAYHYIMDSERGLVAMVLLGWSEDELTVFVAIPKDASLRVDNLLLPLYCLALSHVRSIQRETYLLARDDADSHVRHLLHV